MVIRNDAHRDEFHRDQQWHKPVRAATTANITISTALNAGDTLDGVTLAAGDRVLVKDQSTGAQNGIYIAGSVPARAYDMEAGIQAMGAYVHVIAGTTNGNTLWRNTNTTLPTIGGTALTWEEFTTGGTDFLKNDTYEGVVQAHGSMGATETMSCASGLYHTGTINANVVITLDGFVNSTLSVMTVQLTEDGTGGHTLAFEDPATDDIVWVGGSAPTHDDTAGIVEMYEFWSIDGGATIYGGLIGGGGTALTPASTVEDETALNITPAVGTDLEYARQDHTHGSPSTATIAAAAGLSNAVGPILISDTHSTPIVFGDILLTEDEDDILYADP